MLTIIKRSGKEEAFNIAKIKLSASAASDELRQPLSSGDINLLATTVQNKLKGKETITSKELYSILVGVMRQEGFSELADAYVSNSSNFWV